MISRDERQEICVNKIIDSKVNGILEAATGFGKTWVSGLVLKRNKRDFKGHVIVPTESVKKQWIKFLKFLDLQDKMEVHIINGLVQRDTKLKGDIVIYDECHLFPLGKQFGKIFELTDLSYRLGLSGTLSKKHKEALLKLKTPLKIVDTITIDEAEKNGWCAKTITYNLFVDLNEKEREIYKNLNENFEKNAAYFGSDVNLIIRCGGSSSAKEYVDGIYNSGQILQNHEGLDLTREQARKFIQEKAFWGRKYMQDRKQFIYNATCKLNTSEELISKFIGKFGNKFITFGQTTDSADLLHERLSYHKHIKSVAFHSKMKPIDVAEDILIRHGIIDKEGKTLNLSFKPIRINKEKCANLYMSMFDRNELNGLVSAKALEVGLDAKGVLLGLIVDGDSVKEDYNQIKGRSCRKEIIIYKGQEIDKIACFVNIVLRDTKDESWVKSRQYGSRPARIVNSVDDLIVDFEKVLDNQLNVN